VRDGEIKIGRFQNDSAEVANSITGTRRADVAAVVKLVAVLDLVLVLVLAQYTPLLVVLARVATNLAATTPRIRVREGRRML